MLFIAECMSPLLVTVLILYDPFTEYSCYRKCHVHVNNLQTCEKFSSNRFHSRQQDMR